MKPITNRAFVLGLVSAAVFVSLLPLAMAHADGEDIIDTYWGGDGNGNDIIDTYWGGDNSGNDIIDTYWGGDNSGNDIIDTYWGGDNNGNDIVDTYWGNEGNDIIDTYDGEPNYGCDQDCGGGYDSQCGCFNGGSGGFGGSSIGGGSRSVSTGGGLTILPPRTVTPPVYIPPTYYPPQQPPHVTTTSNNTSIVTNTCTNGSCNNTSTVTNVNQNPTPYYPVVYQQQPAPYCTISIANYGYGNATLTWSAQNASSAYISGVGQVATYGSRQIYATNGTAYTMTVSGAGGSANCQTQAVYYPTPVPTPMPPNTYCQITATPSVIQNGQAAYLTWSSNGGYATISDGIGQVAPNGSLAVRPESSRNYVLTVYGNGGTHSCNTVVTVRGTYVSLTQIPYTGFDFGVVGNAIYWMSLLAFAASLAYLALYFMPTQAGKNLALAFAGNRYKVQMPVKQIAVPVMKPVVRTTPTPIVKKIIPAPLVAKTIEPKVSPVHIELREFKTNDKMTFVNGRLTVNRA